MCVTNRAELHHAELLTRCASVFCRSAVPLLFVRSQDIYMAQMIDTYVAAIRKPTIPGL